MDELKRLELEQLDEVGETEEVEERFRIEDLDTANWAFRKIRAYKSRIQEKEELAQREKERIESWLKEETDADKGSVAYFESLLVEYYREQKAQDAKFKLTTPYGKLTSRKKQPKVEVEDDEKALDYLVMKQPKAVETIRKYNKNDLKKMFEIVEVDGGLVAIDKDGEMLDFVKLEAQDDSYTVKVEGE